MCTTRHRTVLTAIAAAGVLAFAAPAVASICGPGDHWVDGCLPGTDTFPSVAEIGIGLPTAESENLSLSGPTIVRRMSPSDDSVNYPGTRPVDGHQDTIDIEMVALSLVGDSPLFGPVSVELQPSPPTYGVIAEKPTDPSVADSFFDVFFKIDILSAGVALHTETPVRVTSEINKVVPVGSAYEWVGSLPLLDPFGSPSGFRLERVTHIPYPEPSSVVLCCLGAGLLLAQSYRRGK